jgi:glycyl-tRNA synthetase
MEFFVPPAEGERWFEYWKNERMQWFLDLGIKAENLRFYEHPKEKLAHYSRGTFDVEYKFDFPRTEWAELEGVAYRGDFDLSSHSKASGVDLSYFDQESGDRYVPHVVEPALGVDRTALVVLLDGLTEDEAPTGKGGVEKRTVLRVDKRLAPVKAAVLPLSRNERLSPMARELAQTLRERWNVEFDDAGAIGRRYRRQDEIGTPYCVTVDFESLDDNAVTVRERDSMTQERVPLAEVESYLGGQLPAC